MINKLIRIFKARSFFHLIIIFVVFGITGSSSIIVSEPMLQIIKLDELIPFYPLYLFIRLIVIFPIYQILLILIAILFGEFSYFWTIEKKFLKKIGLPLKD